MKSLILKIVAVGGVIALVAILWPIFTEAETSLALIFIVASMVAVGIAALALFSNKRWMMWAALGVWPGAIAGGAIFAGIALLTINDGTTGWEGAIVGAVIIFGVFVGSIAGAITGGVLGARKTRLATSTG
ncbi:MAG: hypothetical protein HQ477_08755 [Chloroflexi bacterium]|nr:hypothetical protein [Chloroflexota bacterium]